jgi:hypothetical protein
VPISPKASRVFGHALPNQNWNFPKWEPGRGRPRGLRPKAFAISLAGGRELWKDICTGKCEAEKAIADSKNGGKSNETSCVRT